MTFKANEYAGTFAETTCAINVLKPLKGFTDNVCLNIDKVIKGERYKVVGAGYHPFRFHTHPYFSYMFVEGGRAKIAPPSAEDLMMLMNIDYGHDSHRYFEIISTLEGLYVISVTPEFQYISMIMRQYKDNNTRLIRDLISKDLMSTKRQLYRFLRAGGKDVDQALDIYKANLHIRPDVASLFGIRKRVELFDIEFIDWKILDNIDYFFLPIVCL